MADSVCFLRSSFLLLRQEENKTVKVWILKNAAMWKWKQPREGENQKEKNNWSSCRTFFALIHIDNKLHQRLRLIRRDSKFNQIVWAVHVVQRVGPIESYLTGNFRRVY